MTVTSPLSSYAFRNGSRYMMVNALSLLDAPSEYFISSTGDKLYFIPPIGTDLHDPPHGQGVFLSQRQHAHEMNGVAHIELRGLHIAYAMGAAVVAQNVTNVALNNCTISSSGTDGVVLNGSNSTISGCRVSDTGCNAVKIVGGDIPSLSSGHLRVHNNSLHRFARVSRTRGVGVVWSGCGGTVSANEIFDAPYIGIMMERHGAMYTFEDNYLHDLAQGVARQVFTAGGRGLTAATSFAATGFVALSPPRGLRKLPL